MAEVRVLQEGKAGGGAEDRWFGGRSGRQVGLRGRRAEGGDRRQIRGWCWDENRAAAAGVRAQAKATFAGWHLCEAQVNRAGRRAKVVAPAGSLGPEPEIRRH